MDGSLTLVDVDALATRLMPPPERIPPQRSRP